MYVYTYIYIYMYIYIYIYVHTYRGPPGRDRARLPDAQGARRISIDSINDNDADNNDNAMSIIK